MEKGLVFFLSALLFSKCNAQGEDEGYVCMHPNYLQAKLLWSLQLG